MPKKRKLTREDKEFAKAMAEINEKWAKANSTGKAEDILEAHQFAKKRLAKG